MHVTMERREPGSRRRHMRLVAMLGIVVIPLIAATASGFAEENRPPEGRAQDTPGSSQAQRCLKGTQQSECNDLSTYCQGHPENCGQQAKCVIECGTRLMLAEQKKSTGGARSGGDGTGRAAGALSEAKAPKSGLSKDESTAAGNAAAARKFQNFLEYKNLRDKGVLD